MFTSARRVLSGPPPIVKTHIAKTFGFPLHTWFCNASACLTVRQNKYITETRGPPLPRQGGSFPPFACRQAMLDNHNSPKYHGSACRGTRILLISRTLREPRESKKPAITGNIVEIGNCDCNAKTNETHDTKSNNNDNDENKPMNNLHASRMRRQDASPKRFVPRSPVKKCTAETLDIRLPR